MTSGRRHRCRILLEEIRRCVNKPIATRVLRAWKEPEEKKKKEKKKRQEEEEEDKQEAVQRGSVFDAFGATSERNLSRFRERDVIRAIHPAKKITPNPSALLHREAHKSKEGQS